MSLSPSQRIILIKEITSRLAAEEYPLIEITLKHFSIPWTDDWPGTKEAYVLKMVAEGNDSSLIELAEHVGFQLPHNFSPKIEAPFWKKGMFRLFVSHLNEYRDYAGTLKREMYSYGISCFIAHKDIEPTLEWQTQIETALSTCDSLIALLHENFHTSNWTDQEVGYAMGRGVPVFAVKYGEDPYGFLARFQAFNGSGKQGSLLAKILFDAYRKNKQTEQRMSEALVNLFEKSSSFADAKTNIGYLEELKVWGPTFSSRIRSAVTKNPQIEESYGIPERVEALVNKWEKMGA